MNFFIWIQFAVVCLLGAMSPGPSVAVIIGNSLNYGRFSGILTSIGHGLGIALYAFVAVIGLGFIIVKYEYLFLIIQIFGSFFLILLGILFIINDVNYNYEKNIKINTNSFIKGFIIAIINPKILIWFTAIFSNFIQNNANLVEKTILVITPFAIDTIWYIVVALVVTSNGLKDFFNKKQSYLQKLIGFFLIVIALSLLYKILFI